jgi:GxxExxY protein
MTCGPHRVIALVACRLDVLGGMNNPRPGSDERTFAIIGAAMEVHRVLRRGFLEAIYYEALAHEFKLREIPFITQVPCSVQYKGQRLHGFYKLDFVCFDDVIVEVKASSATAPADYAQVLNYLAVSGHPIALLLNFGRSSLEYRRFALSDCV